VRANQYLPQVKAILTELGVPEDLAYIPLIESGYQPLVKSSSGQAGLWQLSPSIARSYGLIVTDVLDERLEVDASTRAFARHIFQLYRSTGSWDRAIASFSPADNYLAQLTAGITIAKNPRAYGFSVDLPNI
jgi:membrane-bound lytic murein transglycosylase D